jgi:hypothetical protein
MDDFLPHAGRSSDDRFAIGTAKSKHPRSEFLGGAHHLLFIQTILHRQNDPLKNFYPAFFLTFVPMRNNFRTIPVGNPFIWSYSSVTASKNPAIASSRSRV